MSPPFPAPSSQFHVYKTEAIVLERKDFGEADRLLTLYTPGLGKVRAIAKGARRTTSRLSGHIELFTHTTLFLAAGRNLDIVTQSQLIHSHERLREDLWRAALGFHVLELVNYFTEERLENPAVWHALLEVLGRLDGAEAGPDVEPRIAQRPAAYHSGPETQRSECHIPPSNQPDLAVRYFEAQLLDHTGYRPELRDCTLCRERLEPVENYFHAPSGGVLCGHCAAGHSGLLPMSVEAIKMLRLLQDGDYGLASRLRLTGSVMGQVESAMRRHISHVLERELRSAHLVDELRLGAERRLPSAEAAPHP